MSEKSQLEFLQNFAKSETLNEVNIPIEPGFLFLVTQKSKSGSKCLPIDSYFKNINEYESPHIPLGTQKILFEIKNSESNSVTSPCSPSLSPVYFPNSNKSNEIKEGMRISIYIF